MSAKTASLFFSAALMAAAALLPRTASADVADIVNDIRRSGCENRAAVRTPVERDETLDEAAKIVAAGAELGAALERTRYRALRSTLVNVGGVSSDEAIREVLADGFCDAVNNDEYTAIGTFVRGREFWVVLAAPLTTRDRRDARVTAETVLDLVNDARAERRRCGRKTMDAVPPLKLSAALTRAAAAQAADMADRGEVGHEGSDGSGVAERVQRAGYRWRSVGENVAAGQADAATVVQAWLDSPGHCENIMGPQYTEMGIAFEAMPNSELRIVWAQVLAAPQ